MRPDPPLHVVSLHEDELGEHLDSTNPYNKCVTTMTLTAKLFGPMHRLDHDLVLLDIYTHTFRTGSTRFKNARVVRLQLKSDRGLRWITFKVFYNGTLHICGAYSLDVAEFAVRELVTVLNALHSIPLYEFDMGQVLLVNYRLTVGKRLRLRDVSEYAVQCGHLPWVDAKEMAVVVKMEVEIGVWASVRIFPTGSVSVSVPNCVSRRAQLGALPRVAAFLKQL